MSRVFRPDARLVQEFVYRQEVLPIDRPVVQYVRQSTDTQVKDNEDSTYMQDEELHERLLIIGFIDIRKIDADQGISGQKLRFQRAGLDELYRMIERGEVGAIAAYDASRLWRDTTHIWYNDFIQLIQRYDIPVIFSGEDDVRIFWPKRQQDMDTLREEFKQAAFFLRQIDKLKEAKKRAIEKRVSYGGGSVPFGFIVGTTKIQVGTKTKKRNYYIPYKPHAELIAWIFKRFKELGGNLSRLGQELREMHFQFPAFQGVDRIPRVGLRFNGNGYPLCSRDALLSILTNPAYIGWYIYNGVIVSKEAHKAIVPLDDFLYAYNRLSPITLDGKPNEDKPALDRRRVDVPALLENLLVSGDAPVYVLARTKAYTAQLEKDSWGARAFSVPVDLLDYGLLGTILAMLISLEQMAKEGLQTSLHDQLQGLQEEKIEEVVTLDQALANIDKAIHGWELDKQSCRATGNRNGLDEANRQLAKLYADREAVAARAKSTDQEKEELAKTQSLLDQAIHTWNTFDFNQQKRLVRMLVEKANMTKRTPRVLQVDVTLKEPLTGIMTGYFYLDTVWHYTFTLPELTTIRRMYATEDRFAILQAIPHKPWRAIKDQAHTMGLSRLTRVNTAQFHEEISYEDYLVMEEVGLERNKARWAIPDDVSSAFRRAYPGDIDGYTLEALDAAAQGEVTTLHRNRESQS